MKKLLSVLLLVLVTLLPAHAVLKEKDLARTLGVLRAELASDYEKQQQFLQMYEQQGAAQHQQLVSYMNQCEQIGLMLYSQSYDNTFDQAYACQQAVNLYWSLSDKSGNTLPYDRIIEWLHSELDRYDALITSLRSMPPVAKNDEDLLSQSDSILLNAIDSLASTFVGQDTGTVAAMEVTPMMQGNKDDTPDEPLYLTGQQLEDRAACLEYADSMRNNVQHFLEALEAESVYYHSVQDKVDQLNNFAQKRYKVLQDYIFKMGTDNYITVLSTLPRQLRKARSAASTKYKPFAEHEQENDYSEWRGKSVLFISVFVALYLSIALIIAFALIQWCLPKRWRGRDWPSRRTMLTWVVGTAIFAVYVMVVRHFVNRNYIQMGTGLVMNFAWLLEAVLLSLYIRLKGRQMIDAALVYTPLLMLAFLVIMFRIVLIPDAAINLILPPVLVVFTLWQLWLSGRHRRELPLLDTAYTHITSVVMGVSALVSWSGYSLMAIQIIVWWTFQLAAITTITCLYDLMEMYEENKLLGRVKRIESAKGSDVDVEDHRRMLKRIASGKYITSTWFYDFINRTLVPILAVYSVLVSIYWASEIFAMTSLCVKVFFKDFINQPDLIRVSLFKLCVVVALWFIFSYLNYALRSFYIAYRKKVSPSEGVYNFTLSRNIIAILIWGLYAITVLVLLNVPKSGISIVTAGLATGLGFAMQDLIENFFYGLSLMTGRLRVGDYIECDGISGKVESITYQSTQVITADGCVIAFLNKALFSKNFKNLTRNHNYEQICIPVGVAYGTDVEAVRRIITEALTPICRERNSADVPITDPDRPICVRFNDFGDSSVDLKVLIWMLVEEKYGLTGRLKEAIYNALNANNIEIPFPQRDVHLINEK